MNLRLFDAHNHLQDERLAPRRAGILRALPGAGAVQMVVDNSSGLRLVAATQPRSKAGVASSRSLQTQMVATILPPMTTTVDAIYENGKLAKQGEKIASLPQTKKHACSVLFSHTPGQAKLILTVATPGSTFHTQIDDPFPGFGQIFPNPVLDANGRIPLVLSPARGAAAVGDVDLANAAKALVVQVHRK